jgi:hypothetical protein
MIVCISSPFYSFFIIPTSWALLIITSLRALKHPSQGFSSHKVTQRILKTPLTVQDSNLHSMFERIKNRYDSDRLIEVYTKLYFGSLTVGIALGYGLDDRVSRIRFPAGAGNFSLHHRVQNGSGAHPSSYPMGTRDSFLGVKRPGRESDYSPASSAEVKNAWGYTSISPIRLHGVVLS